jgi:hypothetical protein
MAPPFLHQYVVVEGYSQIVQLSAIKHSFSPALI